MFDENARIMRDHYWRSDMNGVDWDAVVARYRPLVASLGSHDELVDLLWETVAELNTSHAYVQPRTPAGDQARRLGLLGADLRAGRRRLADREDPAGGVERSFGPLAATGGRRRCPGRRCRRRRRWGSGGSTVRSGGVIDRRRGPAGGARAAPG